MKYKIAVLSDDINLVNNLFGYILTLNLSGLSDVSMIRSEKLEFLDFELFENIIVVADDESIESIEKGYILMDSPQRKQVRSILKIKSNNSKFHSHDVIEEMDLSDVRNKIFKILKVIDQKKVFIVQEV